MRRLIIFSVSFLLCVLGQSQGLTIGTTSPHPSAIVEISSNNKGFLLPLVSQVQRISINNPSEGLLVYDSTLHRFYQFQNEIYLRHTNKFPGFCQGYRHVLNKKECRWNY